MLIFYANKLLNSNTEVGGDLNCPYFCGFPGVRCGPFWLYPRKSIIMRFHGNERFFSKITLAFFVTPIWQQHMLKWAKSVTWHFPPKARSLLTFSLNILSYCLVNIKKGHHICSSSRFITILVHGLDTTGRF